MPVVIELLLLSEPGGEPAKVNDRGQIPSAQALYEYLSGQLSDPKSHLRRKSAFAVLLGRGASLRLLGKAPSVHGDDLPFSLACSVPGKRLVDQEPSVTVPAVVVYSTPKAVAPIAGATSVPPILAFPTPPGGGHAGRAANKRLGGAFDWLFGCTVSTCVPEESCAVITPYDPAFTGPCAPLLAANPSADEARLADESFIGGWPLCVPHAYASFPAEMPPSELGSSALSASPEALKGWTGRTAPFRKAAVEVDDHDINVVLAPISVKSSRSVDSGTDPLPSWVQHSRLVVSHTSVPSVKAWNPADVARLWSQGCCSGPPWSEILEINCTPVGAPGLMTVLLALPSATISMQLHDALRKGARRSSQLGIGPHEQLRDAGHAGNPQERSTIRCELRLTADALALESGPLNTNFAAVVVRGICEACRVGQERVRVASMKEDKTGTDVSTLAGVDARAMAQDLRHPVLSPASTYAETA